MSTYSPDSALPSRPNMFASVIQKLRRPPTSSIDPFEVRLSPSNSVDDEFEYLLDDETVIDVQQVSTELFDVEKVAPTKEYNFFQRIGFGVKGAYLALKSRISTVSSEETRELKLYRANQELHTGIAKVKKAFKNYTSAQTAVINNEKDERVQAVRHSERQASDKLLASYNELIEKAIGMTSGLGGTLGNEESLKRGVHDALDKDTENLIFRTINEVRAKMSIGSGLNLGNTPESDQENLQAAYTDFVTHFSAHVQKALAMTGHNDTATVKLITEAYLDGLASVPELGEDLNIIRCHDQLVKLRENPKASEKEVVSHFIKRLNGLIKGETRIQGADLEQIQFRGIPLKAIKAFTHEEISQLQQLQTLNSLVRKQGEGLEELESSLKRITTSLANTTEYSVSEIREFLAADFVRVTDKKDNNLLTAAEDSSLLTGPSGDKFKQFREAADELAQLDGSIDTVQNEAVTTKAEFDARIAQASLAFDKAQVEDQALDGEFENQEKAIAAKKEEINALQRRFARAEEKWKHLVGEDTDVNAFFSNAVGQVQTEQADRIEALKSQEAEATRALDAINVRRSDALQTLNAARLALDEANRLADQASKRSKKELDRLTAERTHLVERKIALSGNDITALKDFLGVEKLPVDLNTDLLNHANLVAGWLIDQRIIQEGARQGTANAIDGIDQLEAKRDTNRARIQKIRTELGMFNEGDSLIFKPEAILGTEGAAKIQERVHANLDLGKEVTYKVADRLVDRIKEERERSAKQVTRSAGRAAILNQTTALETDFGNFEKPARGLFQQMIVAQVNQLQSMPVQTTSAKAVDCALLPGLWTAELSDETFDDDESDDSTSVTPSSKITSKRVTWGADVVGPVTDVDPMVL
jgi:hypothetical protein